MSLIRENHDYVTQFLHNSCKTKNFVAIKKLHAHLLRSGSLFVSHHIQTKLIFTYATCLKKNNLKTLVNSLEFMNPKNPLPFNVVISDFCRNGFPLYALKTFSFMHIKSVPLDTYALCSSLIASSSVRNVNVGKQIHNHVAKSGWLSSVFVGSALIDLYAKLSFVKDAAMLFDEIPVRNTVCANALLSGYCEAKLWGKVLELIRTMPALHLGYDHFTLSAMLQACAGQSTIELGKQVHAHMTRKVHNVEKDGFLQSSLIEMYGKCGFVGKALQVFNLKGFRLGGVRNRDVTVWTSMLGVYGRNGYFDEVIVLFKEMLRKGIRPDEVAFVIVISACSHTGQLKLGIDYFESMVHECKLKPGPEHYSCVVDLLCRAGELDAAWKLMNEMLAQGHEGSSVPMWGALLSACAERGNIELAKMVAKRAMEFEPQSVGLYVMLSNLYGRFRMWDEISQLRELMKERGIKKDAGCSWIEVTG